METIEKAEVELAETRGRYEELVRLLKEEQGRSLHAAEVAREWFGKHERTQAELENERSEGADLKREHAHCERRIRGLEDRIAAYLAGELPDPPVDPIDDPIEPDPPTPDPPSGEPWTHQHAGKTVEELLHVRPPGYRRVKPPSRENITGLLKYEHGEDILLAHKRLSFPGSRTSKLISNAVRAYGKWSDAQAVLANIELGDFEDTLKWLGRLYHLKGLNVAESDCVGRWSAQGLPSPNEHFIYANLHGSSLWEDNCVSEIGGKPVYLAHRPFAWGSVTDDGSLQYQPNNRHYRERPSHTVRRNFFHNVNKGPRGSYDITAFDGGSYEHPGDILIEDLVLLNEWGMERHQGEQDWAAIGTYDESTRPMQTCGAFMAHSYQFVGEDRFALNTFTLRRPLIRLVRGNHGIGGVRNCRDVLLEDGSIEVFDHRNPVIDINGPKKFAVGQKCAERVRVRNNKNILQPVKVRCWMPNGSYRDLPYHTPGKLLTFDGATGQVDEKDE